MAELKYLDKDGLIYVWSLIKTKLSNKVDKVEGKGLSANDLTPTLKAQYDKAQENVIESVKVNGVVLTPTAKAVDVTVPTTADINALINTAIGGITGFSFEIVSTLPSTGEGNKIYLLPKTGSTQNVYTEYIWVSNAWEKIGETDIDLTGYVQTSDLVKITNSEIDTILAM